jgi:hypothetical protein
LKLGYLEMSAFSCNEGKDKIYRERKYFEIKASKQYVC